MNTPGERTRDCVVYLIGNADNRLVKIGMTTKGSLERLNGIQMMSPSILTVLWTTPGGRDLEHELHYRFRTERRHGEWFDFGERDPIAALSDAVAEIGHARQADIVRRNAESGAAWSPTNLAVEIARAADRLGDTLACVHEQTCEPDGLADTFDALAGSMVYLRIAIGMAFHTVDSNARRDWGADLAMTAEIDSRIEIARQGLDMAYVALNSASLIADALVVDEERMAANRSYTELVA